MTAPKMGGDGLADRRSPELHDNYPSYHFLLIVLSSFSADSFTLEKNLCR